jgi:hypothetical protein
MASVHVWHNHPEKEEENHNSNNGEHHNHKSIGGFVARVVSFGGPALGWLTQELGFGLCELLIVQGSSLWSLLNRSNSSFRFTKMWFSQTTSNSIIGTCQRR